MIFKLLVAIFITEAITELVVKSEIAEPFRKKSFELGKTNKFFGWLHKLLDCGYCFSVWAGYVVAILLFRDLNIFFNAGIDWVFLGLFLHRSSNILHNIIDRIHGS